MNNALRFSRARNICRQHFGWMICWNSRYRFMRWELWCHCCCWRLGGKWWWCLWGCFRGITWREICDRTFRWSHCWFAEDVMWIVLKGKLIHCASIKKTSLQGILWGRIRGIPIFWRIHQKLENQRIILSSQKHHSEWWIKYYNIDLHCGLTAWMTRWRMWRRFTWRSVSEWKLLLERTSQAVQWRYAVLLCGFETWLVWRFTELVMRGMTEWKKKQNG